ncbi:MULTISPECIES: Asp23/Gls24 family envelope stress response protein [Enterococcus]|uniref:Stress response regulator gls24 homolog n=1 Tax=Enterococcus innesii TaxID=2839759 RepID=A0ABN6NQX2_9ENTE|nr:MULTISPECIES: Asp23/Gls24 family envelope stress response protein [Enterococcus]MBK0037595.1 Asp23/Gls24 family envelope stress response protein [Enterococcus sp. S52]MBK0070280.1 Asp23/Gls24 family envelope stress response protein [Enterococcus sp. S53]MBK0141120.1 Asp23/Gls24 family envelope stress response protein [Enterococcus sp. S76]MBK0144508.1 Asp23/Gls24 family envelope stress response protein [Enterococcus sp. S77]BDG68599.1 alkaline-shock protein [Enterococcus innesii]
MTDDQQTTNVSNEAAQASPLSFEEKVIETIVGVALQSIDGLISVNGRFLSDMTENLEEQPQVASGIDVEVGKEEVAVDLEVIVAYGKDIPKLFAQVQEVVLEEISRLTSLKVKEINIRIADIVKQETIHQIEG